MKRPVSEILARWYEAEFGEGAFERSLYGHLRKGYIFSGPDYLVMGRPVHSSWSHDDLSDPDLISNDPDTWFVFMAKSRNPLQDLLLLAPYELPNVAFEVQGKIRILSIDNATKLLKRFDRKARGS